MKKIIEIKGMSCEHCKRRVEEALSALDGVSAEVNLKKGIAVLELFKDVTDEKLMAVINEAGYTAVSVTEKQGLFDKFKGANK